MRAWKVVYCSEEAEVRVRQGGCDGECGSEVWQ